MKKSLGLIETIGLTAGIVAADTAVKSANVELIGYELTKGSGMTVIKLVGDVGAVSAAIASAATAASVVGKVISCKVIPRPSDSLELMIKNSDTIGMESHISEESEVPYSEQEEYTDTVLSENNDIEALTKSNLEVEVIEDKPSEDMVDNGEENIDENATSNIEIGEVNKAKSQTSKKKGSTKKNGHKNVQNSSKLDKDGQENK